MCFQNRIGGDGWEHSESEEKDGGIDHLRMLGQAGSCNLGMLGWFQLCRVVADLTQNSSRPV